MNFSARSLAACALALALAPLSVNGDQGALAKGAGRTSLWKVQSGEGGPTIYLAGSIHLLRPEDHPLPPAFEQAFAASDELVVEVASTAMAAAQEQTMQRGMYGGKGKIGDDISPAALRQLRQYLEGAGLPRDAMDGFRPWMASMMISMTEMMKLGCEPELGVDSFFEDRAIRQGKSIKSLETSAFQIGLFAAMDREDQESMLMATFEDAKDMETEFPRMAKAWREGKDEELHAIMNESLEAMPKLRKAVLDERNVDWVGKLEAMLDGERDVMVVVGAGHLVGKAGVVSLLQERGHSVERVGDVAKERPPEKEKPATRPKPEPKPKRFIEL